MRVILILLVIFLNSCFNSENKAFSEKTPPDSGSIIENGHADSNTMATDLDNANQHLPDKLDSTMINKILDQYVNSHPSKQKVAARDLKLIKKVQLTENGKYAKWQEIENDINFQLEMSLKDFEPEKHTYNAGLSAEEFLQVNEDWLYRIDEKPCLGTMTIPETVFQLIKYNIDEKEVEIPVQYYEGLLKASLYSARVLVSHDYKYILLLISGGSASAGYSSVFLLENGRFVDRYIYGYGFERPDDFLSWYDKDRNEPDGKFSGYEIDGVCSLIEKFDELHNQYDNFLNRHLNRIWPNRIYRNNFSYFLYNDAMLNVSYNSNSKTLIGISIKNGDKQIRFPDKYIRDLSNLELHDENVYSLDIKEKTFYFLIFNSVDELKYKNDYSIYFLFDKNGFIDRKIRLYEEYNVPDLDSMHIEILLDHFVNKNSKKRKMKAQDLIKVHKVSINQDYSKAAWERKDNNINIHLDINYKKFDPENHTYNNALSYDAVKDVVPKDTCILEIDGVPSLGIDCNFPNRQYESIEYTLDNKKYIIPKAYYQDLFDPAPWITQVLISEDSRYLFITSGGADGGAAYSVAFLFIDNKFIDRYIYGYGLIGFSSYYGDYESQ